MPDAKDEAVPITEVVSGAPVTASVEAVSVIAQRPDVGAEGVVADRVEGSSRADMLVSVARVLTLLSGLGVAVRPELVPMVVMVVAPSGVGAVVTRVMLPSAGGEVCDHCPVVVAASLVTTPVVATRVGDSTEGSRLACGPDVATTSTEEASVLPVELSMGKPVTWTWAAVSEAVHGEVPGARLWPVVLAVLSGLGITVGTELAPLGLEGATSIVGAPPSLVSSVGGDVTE